MLRTSGAKSWGPVDVHLTCIAYHSVSAGDTAKADALQDSVMEQYKAAVAAMAIPEHNLHKYFTDPEAQAYLAVRQGPEGAVRDLSPKTQGLAAIVGTQSLHPKSGLARGLSARVCNPAVARQGHRARRKMTCAARFKSETRK